MLHYTVQNEVNSPGFCITEGALKFWSLKGTLHHQLSGNWRAEISYLFSQTWQLLLWSEGQLWPYGQGKSSATATGAPPAGRTAPLLAGEKWNTEYVLILHQSWALQQIENFKCISRFTGNYSSGSPLGLWALETGIRSGDSRPWGWNFNIHLLQNTAATWASAWLSKGCAVYSGMWEDCP